MDMHFIADIAVGVIIGLTLMYYYMKNKTSKNPNSLKDELDEIKEYIDSRFRDRDVALSKIANQAPVAAEKVELKADQVEVFNTRAEDATGTTAGAKAVDDAEDLGMPPKKDK